MITSIGNRKMVKFIFDEFEYQIFKELLEGAKHSPEIIQNHDGTKEEAIAVQEVLDFFSISLKEAEMAHEACMNNVLDIESSLSAAVERSISNCPIGKGDTEKESEQ